MPLSKMEDIRSLTDQELSDEIVAVKKQLFELRFQKATRRLEKSHEFKHARHRLSQLMTLERQRQLAEQASSSSSTAQEE
ncbi:MAG: 50S ribosomal protein L29 [Synechococcales cyanobacterium T60_A2020_003]|nr:50S ribosomal protein L29 [Synechococcales cyanobacterium T60_A2020_003]